MTPEAQCIAIAQARGFTTHECPDGLIEWRWPFGSLIGCYPQGQCPSIVPNYTTDLDAMHEAERRLSSMEYAAYRDFLEKNSACCDDMVGGCIDWQLVHATAAQRAEAFIRALNLWRDDA